jgi:hypothetical protein
MRARREPLIDEYSEDGRTAIYTQEGRVVALSELGSVAWGVVGDEWTSADSISQMLEDIFGPPPDGSEIVEATHAVLESLQAEGLVELEA